jgi:hypothetical protein
MSALRDLTRRGHRGRRRRRRQRRNRWFRWWRCRASCGRRSGPLWPGPVRPERWRFRSWRMRRTMATPRSGSHPRRRIAQADRTGLVRPHRASPAATVSLEIGAPGWNAPRSHSRRWNARDQSTRTGKSSLRLVPVCSACFARPRGYTQMWWCHSSGYVYSFHRSFHLLSTPT